MNTITFILAVIGFVCGCAALFLTIYGRRKACKTLASLSLEFVKFKSAAEERMSSIEKRVGDLEEKYGALDIETYNENQRAEQKFLEGVNNILDYNGDAVPRLRTEGLRNE
jgi:hypothetical protein